MEKEIKLPTKLAKVGLTHAEIGSLFVLLSLDDMNDEEKLLWEEDQELQKTIPKLVDRKIVKIDGDNLQVDLTFLDPDKPFWEIYDYDAYDNPIYYHPSHFASDEDGSPLNFMVEPFLCSGEIVYSYIGDLEIAKNGEIDVSHTSWDTLEEAEEDVRELLELELEHLNTQNINGSEK